MRCLKLILITFFLFSCRNKVNVSYKTSEIDFIGNWYSIKNNTYQEFYFTENTMYGYSPYSGDIYQYSYIIKRDSIFRYFIHPELKNQTHEYFSKILKKELLQIKLTSRTLIRLEDENTLEMYINKKLDYKTYDKFGVHRKNLAIPLDSLVKMAE